MEKRFTVIIVEDARLELKGTEAEKFIPILEAIGMGSVIVINLDFILNILFGRGIFFGVLAVLVIIFIIYRKSKVNSYYKAEVEYIARVYSWAKLYVA